MGLKSGTEETGDLRPEYFVQSFERGLSVIRAFGSESSRQTLSEVADVTGLTRAAARRFLLTLVDLGYVCAVGREFFLTPKVLELGYAYLASSRLTDIVQPHLVQLVEDLQAHPEISVFDAGIAILDADEIVYVAQARVDGLLQLNISTGARFPAYITSMGRVLLAAIPERHLDAYLKRIRLRPPTPRAISTKQALRAAIVKVREQGWAVVHREFQDWMCGFAVPVSDRDGQVVASLSIATRATGENAESATRVVVPILQDVARNIARDLKMLPTSPPGLVGAGGPAA